MVDGLPSHLGDLSTLSLEDDSVSGAIVADGGIDYAKLDGTVAKAVTGSPASTSNRLIQGDDGTLGTGSDAWVVFPTAFASAPDYVVATPNASLQNVVAIAGSVNAGSFYIQGETASEAFYWQAGGEA